jgi:hypothetical protein
VSACASHQQQRCVVLLSQPSCLFCLVVLIAAFLSIVIISIVRASCSFVNENSCVCLCAFMCLQRGVDERNTQKKNVSFALLVYIYRCGYRLSASVSFRRNKEQQAESGEMICGLHVVVVWEAGHTGAGTTAFKDHAQNTSNNMDSILNGCTTSFFYCSCSYFPFSRIECHVFTRRRIGLYRRE